jgi:hypothetical protein
MFLIIVLVGLIYSLLLENQKERKQKISYYIMWKQITQIIKDLYIKLSCAMCCKSNCQVQLGRDDNGEQSPVAGATTPITQTTLL